MNEQTLFAVLSPCIYLSSTVDFRAQSTVAAKAFIKGVHNAGQNKSSHQGIISHFMQLKLGTRWSTVGSMIDFKFVELDFRNFDDFVTFKAASILDLVAA